MFRANPTFSGWPLRGAARLAFSVAVTGSSTIWRGIAVAR